MKVSFASWMLLGIEIIVVLLSTFGIVSTTYQTRQQFAESENVRSAKAELLEDWGRLLLEESAFSSPSRVERVAREELNMYLPQADEMLELNNN